MRDHGGNLDWAMQHHGGAAEDWIDLSTGINPVPYPVPEIDAHSWQALPTRADMAALEAAAQAAYGTRAAAVPLAGAQAAIQLVPKLVPSGHAKVLAPTYNEHAAVLRDCGWQVEEVAEPAALAGADLAVVVNPNNPDGRRYRPDALLALAPKVRLLVVDESFADPEPGLSMAGSIGPESEGLVVLRSFGKFYGLAGLRLGFALTGKGLAGRLRSMAGPWPVCGPAIAIGRKALPDRDWHRATCERLDADAARLDALASGAGWRLVGGTPLFRTYEAGDAGAAQERLARVRIWSRIFPYSGSWLRLGMAAGEAEWARLASALSGD
ncbi:MAG TPA: threonine-phosphate decarboxylase CobD [Paracoccaceae bacterium]|nr:threonine-phosphate decarboxylase CobD [Paracoccaceae bacterium]